jgi:hypothetical protein
MAKVIQAPSVAEAYWSFEEKWQTVEANFKVTESEKIYHYLINQKGVVDYLLEAHAKLISLFGEPELFISLREYVDDSEDINLVIDVISDKKSKEAGKLFDKFEQWWLNNLAKLNNVTFILGYK